MQRIIATGKVREVIFNATYFMVTFFVRNWEKSFYYFGSFSSPGLRETQIPTKTGRPWNEMRRPGVQFHVLTQWLDKGPDFLWWNTIFDKGEMSKNPGHCRLEVYLYSLLCLSECGAAEYGQKVDTQPRLSTYFETWDVEEEWVSMLGTNVCFF